MRPQQHTALGTWGWFTAWVLVGGIASFAVLAIASVGIFVLPVALAAGVLVTRRSNGLGVAGILSGLGLPLLYVAYLNRDGPGNVCTAYMSGGESCTQEWSPWPWLAVALVLIGAGLTVFVSRRGRSIGAP